MKTASSQPALHGWSRQGLLLAALVVAIWTGFILVSRAGGVSPLTSWDIIAVRYATAAIFVLPYWFFRRRSSIWSIRYVILAAVGGGVFTISAFAGFKLAPAAHAAVVLTGTQPFWVMLFGWVILGERPQLRIVFALGFVAMGAVFLIHDVGYMSESVMLGDVLLLMAAGCWGLYAVLLRRWHIAPTDATLAVTLLTAMCYLPLYSLLSTGQLEWASPVQIALQAFYQGIVASIIQMVVFVQAVRLLGPMRVGMCMAVVPGLSGILASPILGEALTFWVVAGLLLTSIGVWLGSAPRSDSAFSGRKI